MPSPDTGYSLSADERGVAPLIGFILLFGLLVTAFAGYQATAVPQQNADTEFQHFQDVQDDMIVVRNSISTAGQADNEQFESVQLGTTYRERILALNPPAAAGSLRTSDAYPITVEDDIVSSTRFLEYRNGYNEFEAGSIWYENSVVYLDERDDDGDGNVVILEEQNLVEDGELRITALQNDYQESGVGRASVELYPVDVENADDLSEYEGDVTVGIPTRLNGSEYWEAEIPADLRGNPFVVPPEDNDYAGNDVYELRVEANVDKVSFNTVGINSAPEDEAGAARQDIGENVTNGDDCAIEQSGDVAVNEGQTVNGCIESGGDVDVGENAEVNGNIDAAGAVDLSEGATTEEIEAGGAVSVGSDAETGGITAGGDVGISESAEIDGPIDSGGNVDISEGATTEEIEAGGAVSVGSDAETGGITAGGDVDISENAEINGDIDSDGTVSLGEDATVEGDIFVDNAEDIECGEGSKINGKGCSGYKNSNY